MAGLAEPPASVSVLRGLLYEPYSMATVGIAALVTWRAPQTLGLEPSAYRLASRNGGRAVRCVGRSPRDAGAQPVHLLHLLTMSRPCFGPVPPRAYRDRLAQANRQVGETDVRQGVAWALTVGFLLLVAVPAALELVDGRTQRAFTRMVSLRSDWSDQSSSRGVLPAVAAANRRLLGAISDIGHLLENDTVLVRLLRPGVQHGFTVRLRASASQVYLGRDHWLFYEPDVDYLTGPGFLNARRLASRAAAGDTLTDAPSPDPRPAILGLHRQLAARGIVLIVMPTPVKPTVHPERLLGVRPDAGWIENPSYDPFIRSLRAEGVVVFEPSAALKEQGPLATQAATYLATDTHWRPEAVELVAAELAASIRSQAELPGVDTTVTRRMPVTVSNAGDTLRLLDFPVGQTRYPLETVTIRPVEVDGRPWQPDPDADVLLLGDSFANVYSVDAMGWGGGAGLAEQLAYALRRPVDRLSQNDNGAFASRARLAAAIGRGDRLAGKRVVILQFATRELAFGDWQEIDVNDGPQRLRGATFIEPRSGDRRRVRATIREIAAVPRPGSVPYPDHIVAIRLAGLDPPSGDPSAQIVTYVWSLRDDRPTRAAVLRPGDRVDLDMVPWAEVSVALDAIARSELADPDARLATPWWGRFPEDRP